MTRIEHLEAGHPDGERLGEVREIRQRRPMPRLGLALFHLVPALSLVVLTAWRFLRLRTRALPALRDGA